MCLSPENCYDHLISKSTNKENKEGKERETIVYLRLSNVPEKFYF